MAILLLAYDLNKEPDKTDYRGFYQVRDGYTHIKLSESAYALETTETPRTVFDKLVPFMDNNDNVYVVTLAGPWWGQARQNDINWLQSRIQAQSW
jgi:hypothetical protein